MVGGAVTFAASGVSVTVLSSKDVVVGGVKKVVGVIVTSFVASKCSGSRVVRFKM